MIHFFHQSMSIRLLMSFCKYVQYANCVLVNANPLIGREIKLAQINEFPSVISLGKAPGNNVAHHFCTGTLITEKHVLTGAHCLEINNTTESYMKPGEIVVTAGFIDVTQGIKYEVKEWKGFEKWTAEERITVNYYDIALIHDIAVVTLANYVIENIKPAKLSTLNYKSVHDENLVTAGWGTTNFNIIPYYLLRVDLQVIDRQTCLHNINVTNFPLELISSHFCTNARPPVSLGCGDSGGSIFVNGDEIIGINVADCADHTHPNQQNIHLAVKF